MKDLFAQQRARLRPWQEFVGKLSKPANVGEVTKRISSNVCCMGVYVLHGCVCLYVCWKLLIISLEQIHHFQANYLAISALLFIYCM